MVDVFTQESGYYLR